jgi:hypothetical protein
VGEFGEALFAVEKESEKGRLEEEGEDAFHGERLTDNSTGAARKLRPVGPELELHGDSGYNAKHEVDGEDSCPETRSLVVTLVPAGQRNRLENDDKLRQTHGELGKR